MRTFILACFCLVLLFQVADAQDYIWKPSGDHRDLKSFDKPSYAGEDFRKSEFWNMGDIKGVNLDKTNFEGSRFGDMSITNTSFREANLRQVDASDVNGPMTGCDFTDADITGSSFSLNKEQLMSTQNYKNKNLAGCRIYRADLEKTSFAGFNLTEARLIGCKLEQCDFTGAIIAGLHVDGLDFSQLKSTKTYGTKDLGGILFVKCNFDKADFKGFKLSFFHECSFLDADFRDVTFVPINTDSVRPLGSIVYFAKTTYGFSHCRLDRQQFETTKTFRDRDLSDIVLLNMNLERWSFRQCNLARARFDHSSLTETDFTDADIGNADFSNTNITKKQWASTKTFKGREKFMPPTTQGVDLSDYDFSGMTLKSVTFIGVRLKSARFADAKLVKVHFLNCELEGADFTDAQLDDVYFSVKSPLTWEQFLSTQNGKVRDFSKIKLAYFSVTGWDFSQANLSEKRFYGCDFPDCNFDDATINVKNFATHLVKNMRYADKKHLQNGLTRKQFESTANYRSGKLENADFRSCDLTEVDFSGFDLSGADFEGTNLTNTDFSDATIKGCRFSYSLLDRNTTLTKEQFYSTADYRRGVIENVRFAELDLSGWDFSGKKLVRCEFIDCVFTDTDFTDTQMTGTAFRRWVNTRPMPNPDLTAEQIKRTWNFKNKQMKQLQFEGKFGEDISDLNEK